MLYGNAAHAQQTQASSQSLPSIALAGAMSNKALVVFNNGAPKTMAIGQEHQGVKLLSMQGDKATFQITLPGNTTQRLTLRIGDSPISIGAATPGSASSAKQEIVLAPGQGGHYFSNGYINGKAAQFMLDTGATSIAMGRQEAEAMGVNYLQGEVIGVSTANGVVRAYRVLLDSVEIQGVKITNVEATVTEQPMQFILLGNSFLNRFDMNRTHNRLVLTRRF